MILVICILGYKVQSIMCATNSIFGLKERINSSNSPSAFKGLKRRTQEKRSCLKNQEKMLYVLQRVYINNISKSPNMTMCFKRQAANTSCNFFFYQVIVSCVALLAPTHQQHLNFFNMLSLNTLFNFLALFVHCSISMEFTWSNSTGPEGKLSANKQFISMSMLQVPSPSTKTHMKRFL